MSFLYDLGYVLSEYVLPLGILLFLVLIAWNMFRDREGLRSSAATYTGIINRAKSDPLALHIWDFLTRDRRWNIRAPAPRVIDRSVLAGLDELLAAAGTPLTALRNGALPVVAYLTEKFPELLPPGWRVIAFSTPDGVRVRVTTAAQSEFSSIYNPPYDASAVALFDLCQSILCAVGVRSRDRRETPVRRGA